MIQKWLYFPLPTLQPSLEVFALTMHWLSRHQRNKGHQSQNNYQKKLVGWTGRTILIILFALNLVELEYY